MSEPVDGPAGPADTFYELTLFISGASNRSASAVADARAMCDVHLADRHRLSIVNVNDTPVADFGRWTVVTPTLVKTLPLPARQIVGDLSDVDEVLAMLGLPTSRRVRRAS